MGRKIPNARLLNQKNLRQQATFVEAKQCENVITRETEETIESLTNEDIQLIPIDSGETINAPNEPSTSNDLIAKLKSLFSKHYNDISNADLSERKYLTRFSGKSDTTCLSAINTVISDFITNKDDITFWNINCIQYSAAAALLEYSGRLKECTKQRKTPVKRSWEIQAETQINAIRRKMSYITVMLKSNDRSSMMTTKQRKIEATVKKICGNLKPETLKAKLATLNHQLKVCMVKLKDDRKKSERSRMNSMFNQNQKRVFRNWRGKDIEVKDTPSSSDIRNFWSEIWEKTHPVNLDNSWYNKLKNSYCNDVQVKKYELTEEIFKHVISKMANNKAPGPDRITSYWLKNLHTLHEHLLSLLQKAFQNEIEIPAWLVTSMTVLLPKNTDTHQAKNYRPIACLNTTYKLFTGILNTFIEDHCTYNNIITLEQAGGKKGSWGCIDQLLINKMIMDEVRVHRRNLFVMYFDYRKAFDSISHTWLFEALKLAKVPEQITNVIKSLTIKWSTKVGLQTKETSSITDIIRYLTGLLQGDCLSLLLFILCINPLSHLLNNECEGYLVGPSGTRNTKITNLLFVDDLKTYSTSKSSAMKQLEIITGFTNDIGMQFGEDKCAYVNIEKGMRKQLCNPIKLNGLKLNELKEEDSYKYLGMDEDIGYQGELTKDKVKKEYYRRVKKIWRSELYSKNKITAHNIFATPIFTLTFGILNWTKDEIHQIDVQTRKILTYTGNFHRNSSVDRLYTLRNDGGRGLNSIYDIFVTRLIALHTHLLDTSRVNKYIQLVMHHEENHLVRISNEFRSAMKVNNIETNVSSHVKNIIKKEHKLAYEQKIQHGYVQKQQKSVSGYNKSLTNKWLSRTGTISHSEGYIFAIQEQEITTKALQAKREHGNNPDFDKKCRYCHSKTEDIFHLLCSCECLSSSMYLPMRHNEVAKVVYNAIIQHHFKEHPYIQPPPVWKNNHIELWWDTYVPTVPKVKHNKPDIVIWNNNEKTCMILDICVPLDCNVHEQEKKKMDTYAPLIVGLLRLYPQFKYEVIPLVIGATGLVTNSLVKYLKVIIDNDKNVLKLITKMQVKSLIGSMRVLKSALSLRKS